MEKVLLVAVAALMFGCGAKAVSFPGGVVNYEFTFEPKALEVAGAADARLGLLGLACEHIPYFDRLGVCPDKESE